MCCCPKRTVPLLDVRTRLHNTYCKSSLSVSRVAGPYQDLLNRGGKGCKGTDHPRKARKFFRFNDQPPGQAHITFLGTFCFQCFFLWSTLFSFSYLYSESPNIRSRGGICLLCLMLATALLVGNFSYGKNFR